MIKSRLDFKIDISDNSEILAEGISGKKVLVIGGAGTIGSNYIKQILHFKPRSICVVDHNENGLTELTRDLRSSTLLDYKPEYKTYPIDLLSPVFDKVFRQDFNIVANFAAHKHVRSEKDVLSVEALIRNNVFGAYKLLELCTENKPDYFFSVSTDKSARPVNIMGASKGLMEQIILSYKDAFHVSTARFANVAFSNGSLLDGFKFRLEKRQPLSCPSDIKRYFVSESQAGEICLLATFLGESGETFFPKLSHEKDLINFKDIALEFLKANGFEAELIFDESDAKIFPIHSKYPLYLFKSNSTGEKLFEEFFRENEIINMNDLSTLGKLKVYNCGVTPRDIILEFDKLFKSPNLIKDDIVQLLNEYIPDFSHIELGINLDSKM